MAEVLETVQQSLQGRNSPASSPASEPIGAEGIVIDVSLQARVAESPFWNESACGELLELVHDGIWRLDSDWKTTFVNRRMAEMLDTPPRQLIGRSVFDFLDDGKRDRVVLESCVQLRGMRSEPAELRFRLSGGRELRALVSGTPANSETGEPCGVLLALNDITKRRRIEEELRCRDAELAHAARVNTMGEFVAGIAHEIHQPLHAIAAFAAACQKSLECESRLNLNELRHWTEQISKQTHRITAIIGRLGKFCRRSAQSIATPFDLNGLVRETLEMLTPELRRQSVELELDLSREMPQVEGDDVQIAQVIANLVLNALDAMAEALPARRRICLRTALLGSRLVELSVEDAGPGLSAQHVARIFEPFYTTKDAGMGLGLAICRSIAEAHGGQLTADSTLGKGATFRLQVPLKHPGRADEEPADRVHRGR